MIRFPGSARRPIVWGGVLTLIAMLAACSTEQATSSNGGGGGTLGHPGAVASVTSTPKDVAVAPAGTQPFQAVALTTAGDTSQNALTWLLVGNGTITDTSTSGAGSPAIDFASVVYALPFDMGGICRPKAQGPDAGAIEQQ